MQRAMYNPKDAMTFLVARATSPHERLQSLALDSSPTHHMSVDVQRQPRVGMPELVHHRSRIPRRRRQESKRRCGAACEGRCRRAAERWLELQGVGLPERTSARGCDLGCCPCCVVCRFWRERPEPLARRRRSVPNAPPPRRLRRIGCRTISRRPACVLDTETRMRPAVRSTSRQRSADSS